MSQRRRTVPKGHLTARPARRPAVAELVARHEAGHAVAGVMASLGVRSVEVGRGPDGSWSGRTECPIPDSLWAVVPVRREQIEPWLMQALAGTAAEMDINPYAIDARASRLDIPAAEVIALRSMVGLTALPLGVRRVTREIIPDEHGVAHCELIQAGMDHARAVVWLCRDAIAAVALALVSRGRLTGDDVDLIMRRHPPEDPRSLRAF